MAETMNPALFYTQQINDLRIQLNKLLKRKQFLGWIRFSILAITVLLIWMFSSYGMLTSTALFFIGTTVFLFAVRKDLVNKEAIIMNV
jgi:hypothetical protein